MAEPGMYPGAQANNIDTSEGGQFKNDTKTKHSGRPGLPTITEKEYKGSENSKLFDTVNGSKTYLDLKKEEIAKTLVKASKGTPLYFLQQFNLAGQNVLCFRCNVQLNQNSHSKNFGFENGIKKANVCCG